MRAQLRAEQARLGVGLEPGRRARQRPSAPNAAGSTAGASSLSSAENGTLRASRTPRVRARLTRMRKIQVRSDERPSKPSRPWITRQPRLLDDVVGRGCVRTKSGDAAQRPS